MLKENVMISRETAVDVSSGLVFRLILFNILTNVCEKKLEVFENRMMTKRGGVIQRKIKISQNGLADLETLCVVEMV